MTPIERNSAIQAVLSQINKDQADAEKANDELKQRIADQS